MNISLDWAQPGFPQITGNAVDWNSPMVADLKGDGQKEIVLTSTDGRAYAWHLDGSKLISNPDSFYWYEKQGKDSVKVLAPAAIIAESDSEVFSTPAIGDIDGDGVQEIVFGSDDGYLYALKPKPRWDPVRRDTLAELIPGFPKWVEGFVESSPLLVDLNGDNRLDIVFGSYDRKIHAWWNPSVGDTFREMPGFPVDIGIEVFSSPAAADLFVSVPDQTMGSGGRSGFAQRADEAPGDIVELQIHARGLSQSVVEADLTSGWIGPDRKQLIPRRYRGRVRRLGS